MATGDYARRYGRAIRPRRYSADEAGLPAMLGSLTDSDRWGGMGADHTRRGVAADYLSDLGREAEAAYLRSGRHVMVVNGSGADTRVVPARWTLRPIHLFRQAFADAMLGHGGWEAAHPVLPNGYRVHPRDFIPGAAFEPASEEDEEAVADAEHVTDPARHMADRDTGRPLVVIPDLTGDYTHASVEDAAAAFSESLLGTVFHPGNEVLQHLPPAAVESLWRLARIARHLRLEEPIPGEGDR